MKGTLPPMGQEALFQALIFSGPDALGTVQVFAKEPGQ